MTEKPVLEACVETFEQALHAQNYGADRIELCIDLEVGGLTPGRELLKKVHEALNIPIMVMIRPRPGDFVYTDTEIEKMKAAIDDCRDLRVKGIVLGLLTAENRIDIKKTAGLAAYASPLEVTFHKAIDLTPDPVEAARKITQIPGIQRILTSGGAKTALEGKAVLRKMIAVAAGKVGIVVAGKVTAQNLSGVLKETGGREFHGRRIV